MIKGLSHEENVPHHYKTNKELRREIAGNFNPSYNVHDRTNGQNNS